MKCPLCGYSTAQGGVNAERCTTCPIAGKDCSLTRCPNCGYTFAPDSSLVKFLRKLGGNLSFFMRDIGANPNDPD